MGLYGSPKRPFGGDFGEEIGIFPVSEVDFDPERTSMWTSIHRTGKALRRWRLRRWSVRSVVAFVLVAGGVGLVGLSFLFGAHLIA